MVFFIFFCLYFKLLTGFLIWLLIVIDSLIWITFFLHKYITHISGIWKVEKFWTQHGTKNYWAPFLWKCWICTSCFTSGL